MANLPAANSGSISVANGSDLSYQGKVSFDFDFPGRLKNPRIYVEAFQDGELIYGEAGGASQEFTLGGGGSRWVYEFPNTPAECHATLFYFKNAKSGSEWNGSGQQEYVPLATTEFHADG